MRIAHLSDIHAFALDGVGPSSFLNKRLAGYINLRLRRWKKHSEELFASLVNELNHDPPDEVIVTGDLTNLSLPPEFALARRLLDAIALGADHVTVVPGNHDAYTLGAWREQLFARALGPYSASDTPRLENDLFPVVRVRGDVAIVGVSTALPSLPQLSDGWIGRRQLHALEAALEQLDGKFRVLALHHPPARNRYAFLRGLRDRNELAEVLRRVGCELILHGHEHRDLRSTLPGPRGPIPVVGVGSATYDDPRRDRRARYNVYRIEGGHWMATETLIHDPTSNRFRP